MKIIFMKAVLSLLLCLYLTVGLGGRVLGVDAREGGYVGADEAISTVWNFIRNFSYEQYYWAEDYMFRQNNNAFVDAMNFSFYCGHGNRWLITERDGTVINLATAGGFAHGGWGNIRARYVALYSCRVVPAPDDVTDWYSNWISEPDDVFDGVRQICGYRTNAAVATGNNIAGYFGERMRNGDYVWQSWFNANNIYGDLGYMRASVVMHQSAQYDKYNSSAITAAADDGTLYIIYQY